MQRSISVHLLRTLVTPDELRGGVAVVIDVLRASSTIIHALANGAERVVPCREIDIAKKIAAEIPADQRLLGGERGGEIIEGFDLGNSPREYTREVVKNNTVAFTTTNGTRTLEVCGQAEAVCIGTFLNRQAIVDVLLNDDRPIHLVCAGTDGHVSNEDCLFAGMTASLLKAINDSFDVTSDSTQLAMSLFDEVRHGHRDHGAIIRESRGGRNLIRLGMDNDIHYCSQLDQFAIVPRWNAETNEIRIH